MIVNYYYWRELQYIKFQYIEISLIFVINCRYRRNKRKTNNNSRMVFHYSVLKETCVRVAEARTTLAQFFVKIACGDNLKGLVISSKINFIKIIIRNYQGDIFFYFFFF